MAKVYAGSPRNRRSRHIKARAIVRNTTKILLGAAACCAGLWSAASAQEMPVASDASVFVFNTTLFLISGMVVMFMAAGFCMLEVGLVRSKNAATICIKNIALYSIAGIMVWLLGYNLIYGVSPGGVIGQFGIWGADDAEAQALQAGTR